MSPSGRLSHVPSPASLEGENDGAPLGDVAAGIDPYGRIWSAGTTKKANSTLADNRLRENAIVPGVVRSYKLVRQQGFTKVTSWDRG